MANIQAIVFDLYGTLIYLSDETKPYQKLFVALGLKTTKEFKQARRIALTEDFSNIASLVERIKPGAKIDVQPYETEIQKELSSVIIYPETKKVLEELKNRNLKLGLISNLASPYKKPFYGFGLDKYFNSVLFSCEAGLIKPEPKIYLQMMQELRITPALALMIGDKISADFNGPKSIGMQAVHLDRTKKSPNSISSLEFVLGYI